MLVLVILIVSAIICGAIASSKNKSVLLWVILGFLFPLISILILAMSSDTGPAADSRLTPQPATASIQDQSYDRTKWQALTQYDDDIKRAVEALSPLGQKYVDRLAAAYLALNDKSYLPSIMEKIRATTQEDELREAHLAEVREFDKRVSRYYVTPLGKIVVLRNEKVLAQIDGAVLKYDDPTDFRLKTGKSDDIWDQVTDDTKKVEFLPIFREYV